MPRALTEQEKCRQCEKLLEKGKTVVFSQGIKKTSVDDITKAADMAKGLFYQHFDSKEQYLYALIERIHQQIFTQVEQMINSMEDMKSNIRGFLTNLFSMPEMRFSIQNEQDITALFENMPNHELQSAKQMEGEMFEKMLRLANIDTGKVKPGVVHNYIHTLYLMMGSDLMMEDNLSETVDLITDSLISYITGGVA